MIRLVVIRLLQLPLILTVIFGVTLTLAWFIPGNPLDRPDQSRPPIEIEQAMMRQYNLDSPWRFARSYVWNVLTRLDFGPSLQYRDQRVNDLINSGLPVSAIMGVAALFIALHVGLIAGAIGALRPGGVLDLSSVVIALIGVSLPTFVTGSVLLVVFGGLLQWAPIAGWGTPVHLVLPAITLAAAPAAYIARLIRLGLAEVLSNDYIRTARAKGLSPRTVLIKHAMKVAFLPVLSFMGPAAAATMTGSFVVEKVFAIPGLGEHFVNAVMNKDQFLILGLVLAYSTILVLFNLIVDVAYAWVDPRIELD